MKKTFRDFDKAREFVQSLNLKNTDEWREFTKSPKKPYDIPTNPNMIYKRHGWKGLKDWIGTGEGRKMGFKPYEEAKAFVQSLGIGYQKEWKEYCKSGNKPDDIPVAPDITYKDKGWENWGEWLGTGRMKNKEYRSFEEAKKFVMSLNLKNSSDWEEYCKSGKKPDDIPTYPNQVYKDKGWEGYKNWLGTEFLSYKEARKFVHSLKIKGQVEWNKYCRSGRKPDNIPAGPDVAYKGEGWKNWGDFLGTGRVRNLQFKSYKEAKEFAHSLNMKSSTQWKKYSKSGKKPNDIPSAPDLSYKNKGWKNWGDFLGTSGNQYKLTKKQVKNLKTKKVS